MPSQTDHLDEDWVRRYYIRRVFVLSVSKGKDPNDVVVFAFHGNGAYAMKLAFARPGDELWTIVRIPEYVQYSRGSYENRVIDIVCHGRKVLFLYTNGSIGFCDIDDFTSKEALEVGVSEYMTTPRPGKMLRKALKYVSKIYLVEAFGDLYMVLRHTRWQGVEDTGDYKFMAGTLNFEVYRLEVDAKKWSKVDDLGDVAFFVGDNNSMSFRANGVYKSNCIYFTDYDAEMWCLPECEGWLDMGYFDMETKKVENFHDGHAMVSTFCTPFWFYPQF